MNNTPPPGLALVGAIEIAFNRYLDFNPTAREQSQLLSGKVIGLTVRNSGLTFYFIPHQSSVQISVDPQPKVDADIEASVGDLISMALAENQQVAALKGGISIKGDMQTAEKFQGLLRGVDFDWEELLSQAVGDVFAHQIGKGLRSFFGGGKGAAKQVASNAADYLLNQGNDVVAAEHIDTFAASVDTLRDDVARLEARLLRMEMAKKK
jgi:ubiquinone biosynthesis protein UbiJ